jgi:hypothetical protein
MTLTADSLGSGGATMPHPDTPFLLHPNQTRRPFRSRRYLGRGAIPARGGGAISAVVLSRRTGSAVYTVALSRRQCYLGGTISVAALYRWRRCLGGNPTPNPNLNPISRTLTLNLTLALSA